jgi:hypothetical protein
VIYHYPTTERGASRDNAEVESTKMARTLGLPVFVITPGRTSVSRTVHLGWVEDWDDRAKWFLISFGTSPPPARIPELDQDVPFALTDESIRRKAFRDVREGQQRFKFRVFKRYGPACAVCGIEVPEVLDAAHLCPKDRKGSDDPRNGLVLCRPSSCSGCRSICRRSANHLYPVQPCWSDKGSITHHLSFPSSPSSTPAL